MDTTSYFRRGSQKNQCGRAMHPGALPMVPRQMEALAMDTTSIYKKRVAAYG